MTKGFSRLILFHVMPNEAEKLRKLREKALARGVSPDDLEEHIRFITKCEAEAAADRQREINYNADLSARRVRAADYAAADENDEAPYGDLESEHGDSPAGAPIGGAESVFSEDTTKQAATDDSLLKIERHHQATARIQILRGNFLSGLSEAESQQLERYFAWFHNQAHVTCLLENYHYIFDEDPIRAAAYRQAILVEASKIELFDDLPM